MSSMLIWPRKTPGEVLDYTCDWSGELAESETIATSLWTLLDSSGVAPELTVTNEGINPTESTIIWLANGVPKKKYHLTNKITTSGGRTIEQTIWLRVIDRD